jgi:hypothetical protein
VRARSLLWAGPGVMVLPSRGGEPDPFPAAAELRVDDPVGEPPESSIAPAVPLRGTSLPPPARRGARGR